MTASGAPTTESAKAPAKYQWGFGNIDSCRQALPAWDAKAPVRSLDLLFEYCEKQAKDAVDWYYARKKTKAFGSYGYRILMIVFSAIGGLVPIVTAFACADELERLRFNQLGFLAIGLAALCLALDRFTGSSTGWMRYISAAMAIETLTEDFRLDWVSSRAAWAESPSQDQITAALACIKAFALAVRGEVSKETQAWISEFQRNLAQLEEEARNAWESARKESEAARAEAHKEAQQRETLLKEAVDSQRFGAINLKVTCEAVLDAGFAVEIDRRPYRQNVTGRTCGIVPVSPGLHEIAVAATSSGKPLHASTVVTVAPNAAVALEIALSWISACGWSWNCFLSKRARPRSARSGP